MSFTSKLGRALFALVLVQMSVGNFAQAQTQSVESSSVSTVSEEDVNQALQGSLEQIEQKYDAMSDQEFAAHINSIADQLEQMAKSDKVDDAKRSEMLSVVAQLRTMASDQVSNSESKPKEEAKKLLKELNSGLKVAGRDALEGVAYASAGVVQATTIPVRFVYKFFRGVITGQPVRARKPFHIVASDKVAVLYLVGIEMATLSNPLTAIAGIVLIGATTDLIADTLCQQSDGSNADMQKFCANLDKINQEGYQITSEGDKLGAGLRKNFVPTMKTAVKEAPIVANEIAKDSVIVAKDTAAAANVVAKDSTIAAKAVADESVKIYNSNASKEIRKDGKEAGLFVAKEAVKVYDSKPSEDVRAEGKKIGLAVAGEATKDAKLVANEAKTGANLAADEGKKALNTVTGEAVKIYDSKPSQEIRADGKAVGLTVAKGAEVVAKDSTIAANAVANEAVKVYDSSASQEIRKDGKAAGLFVAKEATAGAQVVAKEAVKVYDSKPSQEIREEGAKLGETVADKATQVAHSVANGAKKVMKSIKKFFKKKPKSSEAQATNASESGESQENAQD